MMPVTRWRRGDCRRVGLASIGVVIAAALVVVVESQAEEARVYALALEREGSGFAGSIVLPGYGTVVVTGERLAGKLWLKAKSAGGEVLGSATAPAIARQSPLYLNPLEGDGSVSPVKLTVSIPGANPKQDQPGSGG